tara:strand:+ start:11387 stop:13792 length:2406 start_codon:yes stop_codon:yes gene_type:complete
MAYAFNKINSYMNKNKDKDTDLETENLTRSAISPAPVQPQTPSAPPPEPETKPQLITSLETTPPPAAQASQPGQAKRARYSPISARAAARKRAKEKGLTRLPGFIGDVGESTQRNKELLDQKKAEYLEQQRKISAKDYAVEPAVLKSATDINTPLGGKSAHGRVSAILRGAWGNIDAPDFGLSRADLGTEDLSQRENIRNLLRRGKERYSPGMARLDMTALESQPEFTKKIMELQAAQEELNKYAQGIYDDDLEGQAETIDEEEWLAGKKALLEQLKKERAELSDLNEVEKELLQNFLVSDPTSEENKAKELEWKRLANTGDKNKFRAALPAGTSDEVANVLFNSYKHEGGGVLKFPHPTIPDKLISRDQLKKLYEDWVIANGPGGTMNIDTAADYYDESETEKDRRLSEWLGEQPAVKSAHFPEELTEFKPYGVTPDVSSAEIDPDVLKKVAEDQWDWEERRSLDPARKAELKVLSNLAKSGDTEKFMKRIRNSEKYGWLFEDLVNDKMDDSQKSVIRRHLTSILKNAYYATPDLVEDMHPRHAANFRTNPDAYKHTRKLYDADREKSRSAIESWLYDHGMQWGFDGDYVDLISPHLTSTSKPNSAEVPYSAGFKPWSEDPTGAGGKRMAKNIADATNLPKKQLFEQVIIPFLMENLSFGGSILDHIAKGNKSPQLKRMHRNADLTKSDAKNKGVFDILAGEGSAATGDIIKNLLDAFVDVDSSRYHHLKPKELRRNAELARVAGRTSKAHQLEWLAKERDRGNHPLTGLVRHPQMQDAVLRSLYAMYANAGGRFRAGIG